MSFWLAAGSAILSGLMGSAEKTNEMRRAASANAAENEAIVKANVRNTVRTGYRAGILNLQRGLSKRVAAQKGFSTTVMAGQAMGAATANQAASGTIGASADAVTTDIRMKTGEALAQQREDYEVDLTNFNIQLGELVYEGQSQTKSAHLLELPSSDDIAKNAFMKAALSFGSKYAESQMALNADSGLDQKLGVTRGEQGYSYYGR